MPKLKPSDKLENTINNINLQWNHGPNKQDVTMIHMSEPHVLASGGDMISIIQQETLNLRNRIKACLFAKTKFGILQQRKNLLKIILYLVLKVSKVLNGIENKGKNLVHFVIQSAQKVLKVFNPFFIKMLR